MGSYQYEQLKEPRQIRLLSLLPGNDEIHFNLQAVNLDDNPEYEAISYCWGDPTDCRTVYCEGKPLQVTISLFTALRQLRIDGHRALWADAVCINQGDDIEKGSQVSLMSLIYSKTSRILIWLGEDKTGLEGVQESMTEALSFLPNDAYETEEILAHNMRLFHDTAERRKQGRPNMHDHDWTSMNRLLLKPWFERKWIIQEVVMAPDSIPRLILCGSFRLSWFDLASINYRICAYGGLWYLSGLSVLNDSLPPYMSSFWINDRRPVIMAGNTYMLMLMKYFRSRGTILDCFIAALTFQCTNSRDHIYALLSLPNSVNIEPDYTLSPDKIWEGFAVKNLIEDQNLKFLALPSCMARDDSGKLPSWIPAINAKMLRNPLSSFTIKAQCFHAGGSTTPRITVSAGHRRLHLTGRLIDTVKSTVPGIWERPFPSAEDVLPKTGFLSQVLMWKRLWFQECKDLAADGDWANFPPAEKRKFYKAMISEMTGLRDPAPQETIDALEVYFDHVADYFNPNYTISDADWNTILTQGSIIEHSVLAMAIGLRFCKTTGGRFGQTSHETLPGDRICIVLGAEIPYVLRPDEGGAFKLVGQCYIGGVMHGEVLEDDKFENAEITLV